MYADYRLSNFLAYRGEKSGLGTVAYPHLSFDLDKIEHNTRTVVSLCSKHGIAVTGVTKSVCGHPEIAKAMLRGGAVSIGDSRLENIRRLRGAGIKTPYMLLRLPALSVVEEVIDCVDVSLNSELAVLEALSAAAQRRGKSHEVVLMVDLGDLREGIWPADLLPFVKEVFKLPGIRVKGLGTNLACFSGAVPSRENMHELVELAETLERTFTIELELISGVNSSGLELIASGKLPRRVNHARIGEAILLGCETIHRRPWPGTFQDAFVLHAEVLELKTKPSAPVGERGEDAFGNVPEFENRGDVDRALLNVGREDLDPAGITPLETNVVVVGASSGYLVVDVTAAHGTVRVGDELSFSVNYGALLAAMTSEYVKKCPMRQGVPLGADHRTASARLEID